MPVAPVLARPRVQLTYADSHTRACRRTGSQEVADQLDGFLKDGLPDGWTKLGNGVSRRALLGPDGFVYKVPFLGEEHLSLGESTYWAMALRHREWRQHVPHHRLLMVGTIPVIAMELVVMDRDRTKSSSAWRVIEKMADHIGCGDSHAGNIGWRGNTPVLLDAGGYRASKTMGCGTCNPQHKDWDAK